MNIRILERILDNNLDVGQYYVLSLIHNELPINTLIQKIIGWKNALVKKDLILDINNVCSLTEKGIEIFNIINSDTLVIEIPLKQAENFDTFCINVHNSIQERIIELTGQKNRKNKSGKMLHSPLSEFKIRMEGFFKKYGKIHDYKKIKKALLNYTEEACLGKNPYALRLIYFIWNEKNGGVVSEMLSTMENISDIEETPKELISDTRKLF